MSKILLISHIFPPAVDGGSKVVYKLGQYFESQHHQTLYLSSNCSSTDDFVSKKPRLVKEGDRGRFIKLPVYHHLRRPLKFLNLFFNQDLLKVLQKGPIFKLFPFLNATIQILKFKPDFIVAGPLPTTTILYAQFLKKIINKFNFPLSSKGNAGLSGRGFCKLIINASFHQTDPDFHQLPLVKSLQSADFIWTLSQYETDYFIKNFNINPSKIILAGNGVDENFLIPRLVKEGDRGRFNILFIGSLAAHKRVDLLIKSFANIPAVDLTIAGQKTLFYPQIQKIVDSLNSDTKSRIHFIFNFSDSKLANLIDNCDVLVLPSIQESFGLVLIEAWARSKPVLVSNISTLSEMIQKTKGGLTFKKDDLIDLQKQLEKIIASSNLRLQLGQNGFNYVKNNYTWEQVGQKIWQEISS
jgi:glycosyltransferase involved in cell wall biosynthesis